MLSRKKDNQLILASMCSFAVLMSLSYFAVKSYGDEIDNLNMVWSVIFLGSGVVLFIQIFYVAEIINNLLTDELTSGRVKIWLSLPLTRKQLFYKVILRMVKRVFIMSLTLYTVLAVVANGIFHTFPQNLFVALVGTVQIVIVLILFSLLLTFIGRDQKSVATIVSAPILLHIVQVFNVMHIADLEGKSNLIYLDTALTILMPLHVAYNNILYGMTPLYDKADIFKEPSSWQSNMIYILWVFVVMAIINRKIKLFES